jgi:hypothetical protein
MVLKIPISSIAQDLPKFTQIWIFGLKIYHLATLFFPGKSGTQTSFNPRGIQVGQTS